MQSNNAHTREQIRLWLKNAIETRNDPSNKEKIKRKRIEKGQKVLKSFGF